MSAGQLGTDRGAARQEIGRGDVVDQMKRKTRETVGKQAYVRRASAALRNTAFCRCLLDQLQNDSDICGLTRV